MYTLRLLHLLRSPEEDLMPGNRYKKSQRMARLRRRVSRAERLQYPPDRLDPLVKEAEKILLEEKDPLEVQHCSREASKPYGVPFLTRFFRTWRANYLIRKANEGP